MKKQLFLGVYFFVYTTTASLFAQKDVASLVQELDNQLTEVSVGKNKIDPSVTGDKNHLGSVFFVINNTDSKGKTSSERYELDISDLSPHALRIATKGDARVVEITTNNRQEFIKFSKDDVFKGYINRFDLPAFDNDAAKVIAETLKAAIAAASNLPENCSSPKSFGDAATLVASLISTTISNDNVQTNQQLQFDKTISTRTILTIQESAKGKSQERQYFFDLADLADNKVKFIVSGKFLKISLASRNGSVIQRTENGKCQSNVDDFTIFCTNIEQGKCLVKSLQYLIGSARNEAERRFPPIPDATKAMQIAAKQVQSFEQCNIRHEQSLAQQCLITHKLTTTEGVKKTETWSYQLNATDINPRAVEIKSSGSDIAVEVKMKDNVNYVKVTKNDVLQNFDNEWEIPVKSSEEAKLLQFALKKAAEVCPKSTASIGCSGKGTAALNCAAKTIKGVGEVVQKLEQMPDNPYKLRFTIEEPKGSVVQITETDWNMKDIDEHRIEMKVTGKDINVVLLAKNNEKILKVTKGDKTEYANRLSITVPDIEFGRALVDVFQKSLE